MAIKRKQTKNLVVKMAGIPSDSSEFDLRAHYLTQHIPSIGSHYVVLQDGDVVKGRDHAEHGNVDRRFNKDSVFIELMGIEESDITPQQRQSVRGVISRLEEIYLDAHELDLTH